MQHHYLFFKINGILLSFQSSLNLRYACWFLFALVCLGGIPAGYGQTSAPPCDLLITTHPPSSSAICTRGIVSVSVSATSNQSLNYQWYKDGTALSSVINTNGVTSATLILADVQASAAGVYSVVVSSSCTSLTSSPFNLSVSPSTHPDYDALADLFYSTNGMNWNNRAQWLTNCDPCSGWFGVSCSQGRSTTMVLTSNNLDGNLPTSFGDLSDLKRVVMFFNPLRGSIPNSIGNLKNLESLNLQLNNFSGAIPESIGDLPKLQSLILSGNRLTNGIPQSFSSLRNLSYLDLSGNPLGGTIPESLSTLTNLTYLSLRANQLQGVIPTWIGNCQNLRFLNLIDNSLTGTIPNSFSALSALEQLEIGGNRLTGSLPDFLVNLSNLYDIHVSNNQITGSIPSRISSLTKLIFLSLDNNQLTGEIPRDFGRLSNLGFLTLHNNRLSGPLPDSLGRLTKLLHLRFNNNLLTGAIPNQFKTLQNLRELDLSNNQFNGNIPNSIGLMAGLQILRLNTNNLSGCIPASLSTLCGKDVTIQNNPGLPNGGDWNAFCTTGAGSYNGTLTTLKTGNWNNAATWSCGRVPMENDDLVIQANHLVLLDSTMPEANCRNLEILGTFSMQGGSIIINGNRIVVDQSNVFTGKGQ